MRLFLQQRPDGHESPRFVQLTLQPDLLGGWTLLRESGQVGGRSQCSWGVDFVKDCCKFRPHDWG